MAAALWKQLGIARLRVEDPCSSWPKASRWPTALPLTARALRLTPAQAPGSRAAQGIAALEASPEEAVPWSEVRESLDKLLGK
jgi:hypothetical protein